MSLEDLDLPPDMRSGPSMELLPSDDPPSAQSSSISSIQTPSSFDTVHKLPSPAFTGVGDTSNLFPRAKDLTSTADFNDRMVFSVGTDTFLEPLTGTWDNGMMDLDQNLWEMENFTAGNVDQQLRHEKSSGYLELAGSMAPASTPTSSHCNNPATGSRSTLILEDVDPDMVTYIMTAMLKSKAQVKMRLTSQE